MALINHYHSERLEEIVSNSTAIESFPTQLSQTGSLTCGEFWLVDFFLKILKIEIVSYFRLGLSDPGSNLDTADPKWIPTHHV